MESRGSRNLPPGVIASALAGLLHGQAQELALELILIDATEYQRLWTRSWLVRECHYQRRYNHDLDYDPLGSGAPEPKAV